MTAIRITSPIELYSIGALIARAIEAMQYPGTKPALVFRELVARAVDPSLGVFVGIEDGEARALCIAMLPTSQLMMAAQVVVAYNDGDPKLSREVGTVLKAWLMEHGARSFLCLNLLHDDDVFRRTFSHVGKGRAVASLLEFRF